MTLVRRYVVPSTAVITGFTAPEPDPDVALDMRPILDLRLRHAALIYGEPGAGKSHALKQLKVDLEKDPKNHVSLVNLKHFSEMELRDAFDGLLEAPHQIGERSFLLLDSLDEAHMKLSRLVPFLDRRISQLQNQSKAWTFIAACRIAESVPSLDELFERLEPNAGFKLLGLRRSDINAIAVERGIDGNAFLSTIDQQSLESLACVPFTLDLLCVAYLEDNGLNGSRSDTYQRAVELILAHGTASDGYTPSTNLPDEPSRMMLVAQRLALFAAMTSTDVYGIATPGNRAVGLPTERVAGVEFESGQRFEVEQSDLQGLLLTGLFADGGPNAREFAHRSLRDYLAAKCLVRWGLKSEQLQSVLISVGGRISIPPQMADLATWLVCLDSEAYGWLVEADPLNLVRNRVAVFRPDLAQRLTELLLKRSEELNALFGWQDSFEGLHFAQRADLINSSLNSSDAQERLMALQILQGSWEPGHESDILATVLDRQQPLLSRKLGIRLLEAHRSSNELATLASSLDDLLAADENSELRGVALQALWPSHISNTVLFQHLTAAPASFVGSYSVFLWRLEHEMSANDVAVDMLQWFAKRPAPGNLEAVDEDHFEGNELDRLLDAAMSIASTIKPMSPETLANLVALLDERLEHHGEKVALHRSKILPETWNRVLTELVQVRSSRPYASAALTWSVDAENQALISPSSDFDWVVAQAATSTGMLKQAWVDIALRLLDIANPHHLEVIWPFRDTEVWPPFGNFLDPVEIDSERAEALKEAWAAPLVRLNKRDPGMSDDEFLRSLREALNAAEVDPKDFAGLARWLDVDRGRKVYSDSMEPDLLMLKSADLLQELDADRVLSAALSYLQTISLDELPLAADLSTYGWSLVSAYQALFTLELRRPESLHSNELPWDAIGRVALNFPIWFHHSEEHAETHRQLLVRIASFARDALDSEVATFIDRVTSSPFPVSSLRDLAVVLNERTGEIVGESLRSRVSASASSLFDLWFTADPNSASAWANTQVNGSIDVDPLRVAILGLFKRAPEDGIPALARLADRDVSLAREVALSAAQDWGFYRHPIDNVELRSVLQLWAWLSENFPQGEDPSRLGFHAVGPREEVANWRDNLLNLVVNAGTAEAVEELMLLAQQHPKLDLEWPLLRARENLRRGGWLPLTVDDLRALDSNPEARVIRSNDGLLKAVLEELDVIQEWLTGETPQAFALWDLRTGASPKNENSISDWYCHSLRMRLVDRGVIVNREVEVIRRTEKGVGLRQDLRVEVADKRTKEQFVVVVEVKGIWNAGTRKNLPTQLAGDYLISGHRTHGIYLVVCVSPDQVLDVPKRRSIQRNLKGDLLADLRSQAKAFEPDLVIVPIIHDASLPLDDESNTVAQ